MDFNEIIHTAHGAVRRRTAHAAEIKTVFVLIRTTSSVLFAATRRKTTEHVVRRRTTVTTTIGLPARINVCGVFLSRASDDAVRCCSTPDDVWRCRTDRTLRRHSAPYMQCECSFSVDVYLNVSSSNSIYAACSGNPRQTVACVDFAMVTIVAYYYTMIVCKVFAATLISNSTHLLLVRPTAARSSTASNAVFLYINQSKFFRNLM